MIHKLKNLIINNCTIKNFLILFLIVQPIFDLKAFYGSISSLIRVFFCVCFFLYYFINSKNKKKYFLLIYPVLIAIYFVFHHLNALKFHSVVPGNFNYSVIKEALYFIKMLSPFLLMYSLFKAHLSKDNIFFVLRSIVLEISLIIIISNLFLFAYGTYSDIKIKANIFEWFNLKSNYTYKDLSSKGLFEVGNQVSAVLLMFLPFIMILNINNKSKINLLTLFSNILALLILGTKVAVFGIFIVFIYTVLCYAILTKKIRNLTILIPFFVFYICLLPFNPAFSRISENKLVVEVSLDISNQTVENVSEGSEDNSLINDKANYILQNYAQNNINGNFVIYRYPYQYDVDFWYDIITSTNPLKSDYRFLEEAMVKRVIEINNNKFDCLLGITYTRVQNIFNIEKDFVMQYYSLGIVGLILVFTPYFIALFLWIIKLFTVRFKKMSILSTLSFATICMMLFIAYYSGNLLNSLGFSLYFAVIFLFLHEQISLSKTVDK